MSARLDPWSDAWQIAQRLRKGARLVVVIAEEATCEKCRAFQTAFHLRAESRPDDEVWLWLDVAEHAEFLGEELPEFLPGIVMYEGSELRICRPVDPRMEDFDRVLTHGTSDDGVSVEPGIRERLIQENWANS